LKFESYAFKRLANTITEVVGHGRQLRVFRLSHALAALEALKVRHPEARSHFQYSVRNETTAQVECQYLSQTWTAAANFQVSLSSTGDSVTDGLRSERRHRSKLYSGETMGLGVNVRTWATSVSATLILFVCYFCYQSYGSSPSQLLHFMTWCLCCHLILSARMPPFVVAS